MPHKADNQQKTKRKRRWLRFSVRGMLLLVTLVCIWLGLLVKRANDQRKVVQFVKELGGHVVYDFELHEELMSKSVEDSLPPGPDWLRNLIGIDYFAEVELVDLEGTSVIDITPLSALRSLEFLNLRHTTVSDLTPLSRLRKLEMLYLSGTRVSDLSPLAGLASLRWLLLGETPVSDLAPLSGLASLEWLYLDGTSASDVTPLSGLENLYFLDLSDSLVTDLTPLTDLDNLRMLHLRGTPVSDLTPLLRMKNLMIWLDPNTKLNVPLQLVGRVNLQ